MSKTTATIELLVAAGLWGFGFIAAMWAMDNVTAFELTFLRFALATGVALPLLVFPIVRQGWRDNIRRAFWPGVFFAFTLILQTWGLAYTTATKSGFITTLYVVLVPILESVVSKRRLPPSIWGCVLVSLIGTGLIVNVGISSINKGDLLTLACAFLAAGQIYVVGLVSPQVRQPFVFNTVQSMWAALICLPFALNAEIWQKLGNFSAWTARAQAGLLILTFGSTIVAFGLQVRAQKRLSATVSSLLFLLESPFAMVFAILLLNEHLGPLETAGAILIFLSAATASVLESRRIGYPAG